MFGKDIISGLKEELTTAKEDLEKLRAADIEQLEAFASYTREANGRAHQAEVDYLAAQDELRIARGEIDTLSSEVVGLEQKMINGENVLPDEQFNVATLVRVLREELACTNHELAELKEAVRASQTLLKPYLGE